MRCSYLSDLRVRRGCLVEHCLYRGRQAAGNGANVDDHLVVRLVSRLTGHLRYHRVEQVFWREAARILMADGNAILALGIAARYAGVAVAVDLRADLALRVAVRGVRTVKRGCRGIKDETAHLRKVEVAQVLVDDGGGPTVGHLDAPFLRARLPGLDLILEPIQLVDENACCREAT